MSVFAAIKHLTLALLGLVILALPFMPGLARGETLEGPVAARVTQVVDGDTLWVEARIWLGQTVTAKVRLAGIDAPEKGKRAGCPDEADRAAASKARVEALVSGRNVALIDIRPDKYAGRVNARMVRDDGVDIAQVLLAEGLAVPYDPPAQSWCPLPGEARIN